MRIQAFNRIFHGLFSILNFIEGGGDSTSLRDLRIYRVKPYVLLCPEHPFHQTGTLFQCRNLCTSCVPCPKPVYYHKTCQKLTDFITKLTPFVKKIIWFNPPFNKNVLINMEKQFLNLINKHAVQNFQSKHSKTQPQLHKKIGCIGKKHKKRYLKDENH